MLFARLILRNVGTVGAAVCSSLFAIALCNAQVITTVAGGGGELADNGPATNAQLQQPSGVAFDSVGNMYIADPQDQRVRKVSTTGVITTFAGNGTRGFSGDGGAATSATLNGPHGVAVDASDNVYIADQLNNRIRKVTPTGTITTVAGIASAGFSGDGNPATSAALNGPIDVAFDSVGNLYIADQRNNRIRRMVVGGSITTVAGNGNGSFSGDGGAATSAGCPSPAGIVVDTAGNIYMADAGSRVRRISVGGIITTVAGSGAAGSSGDGGLATAATLQNPAGVALDSAGNIYIADTFNNRVRKVSPAGTISTVAGGGGVASNFGDGGLATNASLALPLGMRVDAAGNLYIADSNHGRIRRVAASAATSAITVSPKALAFTYSINGSIPAAQPVSVTSSAGTLTISPSVTAGSSWLSISPISGSTPFTFNVSVNPGAMTAGTYSGTITVPPPAGTGAASITVTVSLLIQLGTGAITTVAGTGLAAFGGDGGAATAAWISGPLGLAIDKTGAVYIADAGSFRIRKMDAGGVITTVAGNGTIGFSGDGGAATSAAMFPPINTYQGIAVDALGNLYIADYGNNRIRKVTSAGIISTVAGTGIPIFSGDGGQATSAGLSHPSSVAVDSAGNLYIAELLSARVRKVTPAGIISTVAGSGSLGSSGDGGPATSAAFNAPQVVAVDSAGNLYIADTTAARVRKVNTAGIITTIAGNGTHGSSAGDGGPATSAALDPLGITVDSAGNVFIVDHNNRVRKVDTAGIITTVAGTGVFGSSGDGGPATQARLANPADVALDSAGNLYIADTSNNKVRKIAGAVAAPGGSAPNVALVANAFGEAATIAPNTWVEIKGQGLGGLARIWGDSDFANGQMPTQLDGVGVTVNGKNAFIYYISQNQVNILTPPDTLSGSVEVRLTRGSFSSSMNVQAGALAPSFFVFDGIHATATHLNGNLVGPTNLYPGFSTPVKPNESIVLYANGLGTTSSPIVSGSVTQSGTLPQLPVLKIGGLTATVSFAGLVSPGLYQLNVTVPPGVPDGDNALTGTYNGAPMQSGVILAVQH